MLQKQAALGISCGSWLHQGVRQISWELWLVFDYSSLISTYTRRIGYIQMFVGIKYYILCDFYEQFVLGLIHATGIDQNIGRMFSETPK